jgi:hypothetical protein
MTADEIVEVIQANIDETVCVTYDDGRTEKLLVHTVDDEGFVCDIATAENEERDASLCLLGPLSGCHGCSPVLKPNGNRSRVRATEEIERHSRMADIGLRVTSHEREWERNL